MVKKPYVDNLEGAVSRNSYYRKVVFTGKHLQLVLMNLQPRQEIGTEAHSDTDQFFRFEAGEGIVIIDGVKHRVAPGSGVVVPCGSEHNIKNTSTSKLLEFYTLYSKPEHRDGIVQKTKQDPEVKPRK